MNGLALWRRLRTHVDWPLLLVVMAIAGIGLLNLYSATHAVPQRGLFQSQLWWMAIGFSLFSAFTVIDYRLWIRLAWVFLILGVVLIVAVHFGGIVVKGSRRWLGLGPIRLQPSEFIKIAVILALARFVQENSGDDPQPLSVITQVFGIGGTIGLIAWQPDLGTAVLVSLIVLSVAILAAKKLWPIFLALGVGGIAIIPIWTYYLHDYQKKRILTFMDPSSDPSGAGWHARQSIFAVGSGRIGGKGFMHGTQNQLQFLPEHWSDFPFSVWAEEWGFIGSALLIGLYLFLILWIINIASQARDRFGATICIGVAAMIFWQVIVNIAMVTGLAPVVGVTLPLISHGGSSVMTTFIGLGLVASVSIRRFAH
jgi:rod shape determining protein RodA